MKIKIKIKYVVSLLFRIGAINCSSIVKEEICQKIRKIADKFVMMILIKFVSHNFFVF